MGKLFKVLLLGIGICLVFSDVLLADDPLSFPIPIDVNILTAYTFNVKVRNISNDAEAGLSFSPAGVTTAAPWRVSDQYLDIEYSSNAGSWGIKIITDNLTAWPAMAGNPISCGEPYDKDTTVPPDGVMDSYIDVDGDGDPDNGNWEDDDEILSYAGIVNIGAGNLINPTLRAALGWQVYADKVAKPANPTDASYGGNPYSSAWAYLSDESNNVMDTNGTRKQKPAPGVGDMLAGDEGITTGTTADGKTIYNYALVAYGGVGQALAQHPAADPKVANDTDGDGAYDIAVYLTARFASSDYSTGSKVDFVLPGGSYSAKLYVEIVQE